MIEFKEVSTLDDIDVIRDEINLIEDALYNEDDPKMKDEYMDYLDALSDQEKFVERDIAKQESEINYNRYG